MVKPAPDIVPDAARLVKEPACGDTAPIDILLMLPGTPAVKMIDPEGVADMLVLTTRLVKVPFAAVVAPTVAPLIAPPVIATALAFWVAIVPSDDVSA